MSRSEKGYVPKRERWPKIFPAASRYQFLRGLACPSLLVMRFSPTANFLGPIALQ